MSLQNLKGDPNAEYFVKRELTRCKIPVEPTEAPINAEVHSNLIGKLGGFEFIRKATSWEVKCRIPVEAAAEITDDPLIEDIWPQGFAATPPEHVAVWEMPDGTEARPPGRPDADQFITRYMVQSEAALRYLVEKFQELGLIEELTPA